MSRRDGRLRNAFLLSSLLHGAIIGLFWATALRTERLPQMRVYAVNIVSPPPQEAGPPMSDPEPEPPTPEEEPEPEPEVEPEPEPEPEPTPAPPERTPPRQQPPPPRREPEPEPEPRQPPPRRETPPTTGARPDPTSTGGDDIDVQLPGVQCPTPDYCNNIIRQVNRYFRSPGGASAGTADVYFIINRDGSISSLRLVSSTGGSAFRFAVMEAVEQAGINRAFGPLPREYQADQLPVSFYFVPAR